MVVGVNYNGVWVLFGVLVFMFDVYKNDFYVVGFDVFGVVWVVGKDVKNWKVGDEVVVYCNMIDGDDEECNGGDFMYLNM